MYLFLPYVAHAQPSNLADVATLILNLVNDIVPVLIGIGVAIFFWGLAQTIFKAGDVEARKQGRTTMIYGVASLFVVTSLWGILRLVIVTFGL